MKVTHSIRGYTAPPAGFFSLEAPLLAPALIGCTLSRVSGAGRLSGVIVETEAYTENDPASHSFGGPTGRNIQMFAPGGTAYVYLIYGIHHCINVTSGREGSGEAVLIRALRPLEGLETMRSNRGFRADRELCRGPGRLCQALGITLDQDGLRFGEGELSILVPEVDHAGQILTSARIGISRGREREWRFRSADDEWVSG